MLQGYIGEIEVDPFHQRIAGDDGPFPIKIHDGCIITDPFYGSSYPGWTDVLFDPFDEAEFAEFADRGGLCGFVHERKCLGLQR